MMILIYGLMMSDEIHNHLMRPQPPIIFLLLLVGVGGCQLNTLTHTLSLSLSLSLPFSPSSPLARRIFLSPLLFFFFSFSLLLFFFFFFLSLPFLRALKICR